MSQICDSSYLINFDCLYQKIKQAKKFKEYGQLSKVFSSNGIIAQQIMYFFKKRTEGIAKVDIIRLFYGVMIHNFQQIWYQKDFKQSKNTVQIKLNLKSTANLQKQAEIYYYIYSLNVEVQYVQEERTTTINLEQTNQQIRAYISKFGKTQNGFGFQFFWV
ncbi:unnamed protein product (macronuclear) [Paramecium tetraurelia]|uniref:Transmembrane protein n=1 Tax=Paramecium tetraurelia TaxID=5888 RepID=A0DD23_PARTE|nr:uncharacterized protein GSPATT00015799001 [Paramecium tetraurelia]CAK80940.1 unnamed protein product [Paramecium tetraurelia]|eukprot:XP_001448337.1 hypothetical protein (macronuclear) [Paramecium tetraurelia strain d4-2]